MKSTRYLLLVWILASATAGALEVRKADDAHKRPDPFSAAPAPRVSSPADEDQRPFVDDPTAGGMGISGHDVPLTPYTLVTVTFPTEVVGAELIDVSGVESPVVVWPSIGTEFIWRTPSSGDLILQGPVMPDQDYRLRLREGLSAHSGSALPVADWGATMTSPSLTVVNPAFGDRGFIGSRPQVHVEFNYPVDLATVAAGAWFQDRKTRKRQPAEAVVSTSSDSPGGAPEDVSSLRFRPKEGLMVDTHYDFVIDGVRDALAGRGLRYPYVEPLGRTRPLTIDYVAARNFAMEKPHVVVKFHQALGDDPLPADALKFTPSVPGLRLRVEGSTIVADGDFAVPSRYRVRVSDAIKAASGFGLAKPSEWGATFGRMPGAVIFPDRVIRQRSATGLRFALYQAATGPLTWRLAAIPPGRFVEIQTRLREFDESLKDESGDPVWGPDGLIRQVPTKPLIPEFALETVAEGQLPAASGDAPELREVVWKGSGGRVPQSAMLLEVTGEDRNGRLVGNRAIVLFGDVAVTRKQSLDGSTIRVARFSDGMPVEGARVALLDKNMSEGSSATTTAAGLVSFTDAAMAACSTIAVDADGIRTLQPLDLSDRFPAGYLSPRPPPTARAFAFTDRPLYRPSQVVYFKGFVRDTTGGIPTDGSVDWEVRRSGSRDVIGSGRSPLSAEGGWHGEWTSADSTEPGGYELSASLDGDPLPSSVWFRIEEFRVPPFSVVCEDIKAASPAESVVRVSSRYFHGAPNTGARVEWKATWYGDSEDGYYYDRGEDGMTRVDLFSETASRPAIVAEASGEVVLDENGTATITNAAPFPDPGNRAHATVTWRVEVTGPDGQTLPGGAMQRVAMRSALLGVKSQESPDGKLVFAWDALNPFAGDPGKPDATLYRVTSLTAKERIAPDVYRYQNSDVFTRVAALAALPPGDFEFPVKEPGRYVIVLTPPAGSPAMAVSEEVFVEGRGDAGTPIESDNTAGVVGVDASRVPRNTPWEVGETAELRVTAPTAGVAWVSVETDHILDTFTVPLEGSLSRIQLPVKPEYEPNAHVTVYLLRPGGTESLAGEMFGSTDLAVESPGRQLAIEVASNLPAVRPGEEVLGQVRVRSAGLPVPGADLAIAIVDDAILELGGWQLPDGIVSRFFPYRSHGVVTYSALKAYIDTIPTPWLTAKGFTIGDGGPESTPNTTFPRKDFRPLILWVPSVLTDNDGIARFACRAPDNLTRFRTIVVAQTRDNRFGAAAGTFEVSKPLMVEPALPRFLRVGDEVTLRAVVRTKGDAADAVVNCTASDGLTLLTEDTQSVRVAPDAPGVVLFRARAEGQGTSKVAFEVAAAGERDAVEVTVPVAGSSIRVTESFASPQLGNPFAASSLAPGSWVGSGKSGDFRLAVSSSPYLPKLLGLPLLIDYPHGCTEQRASRLLALTELARLLTDLPDGASRSSNYGGVIADTLAGFEGSLLPGGFLPYWPNGTTPGIFVTLQAAWAASSAAEAGYQVPPRLLSETAGAARTILENRCEGATPTLRALALFILSRTGDAGIEASAQDLMLNRDRLTTDGKAWLTLALLKLGILPDAVVQLVRELPTTIGTIAFDPMTFASTARSEALVTWVRLVNDPGSDAPALRARLDALLDSSASLSTQENLWTLLAFNALRDAKPAPRLRKTLEAPMLSPNGSAAAWGPLPLDQLGSLVIRGLPKAGSAVLTASYELPASEAKPVSRSMRLDRVVKNLTEAARDGSVGNPFRLGDRILISYRFASDAPQSFVALDDLLPAGLEVVNPNLALFGSMIDLPDEGLPLANLSHSALRDQATNLYFDSLPGGTSTYAVLARATSAGTFAWPPATLAPMYDSRFGARTASSTLRIAE